MIKRKIKRLINGIIGALFDPESHSINRYRD